MKSKNLGTKVLALIAVGFVGATSPTAQASPITYFLNFTSGPDTLTGSITTDGSIGAILTTNIVAWSLTVTGTAPFSMSTANPTFLQCFGSGVCFTASPTTLTFDFLSTTTEDPHALFLQADPLVGVVNFYNSAPNYCPPAGCIVVTSFNPPLPFVDQYIWSVVGPSDGVVGRVMATVPEPGTLALLGLGLAGLALSRKRKAV